MLACLTKVFLALGGKWGPSQGSHIGQRLARAAAPAGSPSAVALGAHSCPAGLPQRFSKLLVLSLGCIEGFAMWEANKMLGAGQEPVALPGVMGPLLPCGSRSVPALPCWLS